jgi:ribosomal 50S subunit-recycling heat shock protein
MRIDQALHRLCLFKTRSQAERACEDGRVWVNGHPARPSKLVRPGDRVRFQDRLGRVEQEIELLALPEGSVSRAAAREMVRIVSRRVLEDPWEPSRPEAPPE